MDEDGSLISDARDFHVDVERERCFADVDVRSPGDDVVIVVVWMVEKRWEVRESAEIKIGARGTMLEHVVMALDGGVGAVSARGSLVPT